METDFLKENYVVYVLLDSLTKYNFPSEPADSEVVRGAGVGAGGGPEAGPQGGHRPGDRGGVGGGQDGRG